jgi:CBS domain-containing protein
MVTVKDILKGKGTDVWTVEAGAKVIDALRILADKNVGALVVMNGKRPVGMISERDYARKVALLERSSLETKVKDIMTSQVYGVQHATTADQCMALMTERRIRHLPVFEAGRLVGLVSIGDVVRSLVAEQQGTIENLQNYILGKYS